MSLMVERTSSLTGVILAPNPGPMTLDGTNSYLIGDGGSNDIVIVDPGPDDPGHIDAIMSAGTIKLILITHHHSDHTQASRELHRRTGASVRAFDSAYCHDGAPLSEGGLIEAAGVRIRVDATPGHSPDSVCFFLPDDGDSGSVLSGDTILGRGTPVLDPGEGSLAAYLASIARLRSHGDATVLPGHGATLPSIQIVCESYLRHRQERLSNVQAAIDALGRNATIQAITDVVYSDVAESVRFAAEMSVTAQLAYLRSIE